jgi:hypothetical protein
MVNLRCPYCGEPASLWLDPDASEGSYVEDCPVCCRPWQVSLWRDDDGELVASLARDDD